MFNSIKILLLNRELSPRHEYYVIGSVSIIYLGGCKKALLLCEKMCVLAIPADVRRGKMV